MESMMMDQYYQSMMNPRRGARSMNNLHPSMSNLSQLIMSMDDHNQPLHSYGSLYINTNNHSLMPLHSSLPISFSQAPPVHQPPLLPLPTMASPSNKKMSAPRSVGNGYKHGGQRKKTISQPSTFPKASKEIQAGVPKSITHEAKVKLLHKSSTSSSEEEFGNGEGVDESIYSLSPPPSSLPLPSLALMRPRASMQTSCTAEAAGVGGRGGSGVTVVAANDLRRLLRL